MSSDQKEKTQKKGIGRFILTKGAVKRILFIYLPLALAIYIGLYSAGVSLDRPARYVDLEQNYADNIPVVYSDAYPMAFFGLEERHPFDTRKGARIYNMLVSSGAIAPGKVIEAGKPPNDVLALTHSKDYLDSLEKPFTLARITELAFLRFFPSRLAKNVILEPMLYQAGGSLQAALAALDHGWAINLGGGFHHASYANGEGFCTIADISMIVKYLRQKDLIKTAMIVDLDAHQGNGHSADFTGEDDVYIIDAFNTEIYPQDDEAERGIDLAIELPAWAEDDEFLPRVENALEKAFDDFAPDIVIYVAGTDLLSGDPLGALEISPEAMMKRDELVFKAALEHDVPVVMLLSGGYQKTNAPLIAESIKRLGKKFDLF